MEVVQLVRTQTELEVEVRKLKETLERAEAQTAEAREQAQAARDQAASTRCVQALSRSREMGWDGPVLTSRVVVCRAEMESLEQNIEAAVE